MHLNASNLCVSPYLSDAFSCDAAQKKTGQTLPNGQYLLTNGSVSFKVSKMQHSLTYQKQSITFLRIIYKEY